MKLDTGKIMNSIPAVALPFIGPAAAFAAEGTGRVR